MTAGLLAALVAEAIAAQAGGAQQQKVAVLDLATPGLEPEAGKAISRNLVTIISAEVAKLGYAVLSSADLEAMLSYERKRDLVGCESDASCLAEIGGALGTDLLIGGTAGKLGTTFELALSLIDIRSATVKKRFQGTAGSEAVLASTVRRGVAVLFEKAQDSAAMATLFVKTQPPGGTVFVDGKEIGVAPVTVDELPAGDHEVVARQGELEGRHAVHLAAGKLERLTITLEAGRPVKLKVLSTPPEARVLLDGTEVGQTPLLLDEVRPGRHSLAIEAEGYAPFEQELDLSRQAYEASGEQPFKVEATLERPFELLPVRVGLSAGVMVDAMRTGDGVAGSYELFVEPLGRLELGVGLTVPVAIPVTLRYWLAFGSLEVAPLLRAAVYEVAHTGVFELAIGGGVSAAWSTRVAVGRLGVRLDVTVSQDTANDGFSSPVSLATFWRL